MFHGGPLQYPGSQLATGSVMALCPLRLPTRGKPGAPRSSPRCWCSVWRAASSIPPPVCPVTRDACCLRTTWETVRQVLLSMRRRKAQELSTAEREAIAQEFLFKVNKAAEDDEDAVSRGKPALNKLKMLKVMARTKHARNLVRRGIPLPLLSPSSARTRALEGGRLLGHALSLSARVSPWGRASDGQDDIGEEGATRDLPGV